MFVLVVMHALVDVNGISGGEKRKHSLLEFLSLIGHRPLKISGRLCLRARQEKFAEEF
jgi:hypothetical protein